MRELTGPLKQIVWLWAAIAAAAHFYFGGFGFLEPLQQRSFHLLCFMPIVFFLFPAGSFSPRHRPSVLDFACAGLSVLVNLYPLMNHEVVYARSEYLDELTQVQFWFGVIAVVLLVEAIRRGVTPVLAGIVVLGLVYMLTTEYMPGVLNYRDISFEHVIETMYLIPIGGMYGPLTGISATTVSMFIIFGAFVQASQTGRLFANFGAAIAGRYTGGPAKVAVVTSGLFGTMSGSSVSNVVTTGSITIPLMKRIGYAAPVAGGIEAAASVGGALMPPVMGAAAFVMAEITNIPYGDIIVAAALGAVLYYFTILVNVHFEAKKSGLSAMDPADIPRWGVVLRDLHLVIPIIVLVYFLMERWSGNFAAFTSTVVMFLVAGLKSDTRIGPRKLIDAFADAGSVLGLVALAVAGAGMITSSLTTTGLVLAFSGFIKVLAGGQMWIIAVLLMITCLILGMGVPTTPAYIITAAIGARLLVEFGISTMAAHLFIFYFAILADATPPVAVASYAAAAIAQANPMTTGVQAWRFALGGFVVGYAYLYDPEIMLTGSVIDIVRVFCTLAGATTLIAAGYVGFMRAPLSGWVRPIVLAVGGLGCFGHFMPEWIRTGMVAATLLLLYLAAPMLQGSAEVRKREG
ncbi:MAG: TRAP transporter fused permease subunit [Alphaproteobacteria bacterium]|nr:TRAP transporter fused permease subunit [Alphaproteobacteria bacterium]